MNGGRELTLCNASSGHNAPFQGISTVVPHFDVEALLVVEKFL